MRLDSALVVRKLCGSRQEAQELIALGVVLVDGVAVTKQVKDIGDKVLLEVTSRRPYVSRGGEKLEGALFAIYKSRDAVREALQGKTAVDVGSSTGGFTDCLLSYGVSSVTAVDVGSSQLHARLRIDPRVHLFENTDVRDFNAMFTFDYIVADLSFIPLEKVLENITSLGSKGSCYFLLIKPQFEVGKGNTKKGIVKDMVLITSILEKYQLSAIAKGLTDIEVFPSIVTGRDGNQEYFLYGKHA